MTTHYFPHWSWGSPGDALRSLQRLAGQHLGETWLVCSVPSHPSRLPAVVRTAEEGTENAEAWQRGDPQLGKKQA